MTKRPEYQILKSEFVARIQQQQGVDAFDLCKIIAWKSARAVANITVNNPDQIVEVTSRAHAELSAWLNHNVITDTHTDWGQLQTDISRALGTTGGSAGLLSLHGIGYPTASAILRVWNPRTFPVVDQHAARYLREAAPDDRYRDLYSPTGYSAFIQRLCQQRGPNPDRVNNLLGPLGESDVVHDLDKEAMWRGQEMLKHRNKTTKPAD